MLFYYHCAWERLANKFPARLAAEVAWLLSMARFTRGPDNTIFIILALAVWFHKRPYRMGTRPPLAFTHPWPIRWVRGLPNNQLFYLRGRIHLHSNSKRKGSQMTKPTHTHLPKFVHALIKTNVVTFFTKFLEKKGWAAFKHFV